MSRPGLFRQSKKRININSRYESYKIDCFMYKPRKVYNAIILSEYLYSRKKKRKGVGKRAKGNKRRKGITRNYKPQTLQLSYLLQQEGGVGGRAGWGRKERGRIGRAVYVTKAPVGPTDS